MYSPKRVDSIVAMCRNYCDSPFTLPRYLLIYDATFFILVILKRFFYALDENYFAITDLSYSHWT